MEVEGLRETTNERQRTRRTGTHLAERQSGKESSREGTSVWVIPDLAGCSCLGREKEKETKP